MKLNPESSKLFGPKLFGPKVKISQAQKPDDPDRFDQEDANFFKHLEPCDTYILTT